MKKYILLFYLIIALIVFNYWILFYHQPSTSSSLQDTTFLVKQYHHFVSALFQTKPDPVDTLLHKKTEQPTTFSLDDEIRHSLAMGYVDLSNVYLFHGDYVAGKELRNSALDIAGRNDLEINALVFDRDGLFCFQHLQSPFKPDVNERVKLLSTKIQREQFHDGPLNLLAATAYHRDSIVLCWRNYGSSHFSQEYQWAEYLLQCEQHLGNVYHLLKRDDEAINWYKQALAMAIDLGVQEQVVEGYNQLGEAYRNVGDYRQANDAYVCLLEIEETVGDKECLANGYRSLGSVHFMCKDYTSSLNYYLKAIQLDTCLQLDKQTADDYAGISSVCSENGQMAQAVAYCSLAEQAYQKVDDGYGVSESNRLLGDLWYQQKKYNFSLAFYQRALAQKKKLNDQNGLAEVYSRLSELYANNPVKGSGNTNHLQTALTYGIQAYQIAERLNIQPIIANATRSVTRAYLKLKSFGRTFRFLETNRLTNDLSYKQSIAEALVFAQVHLNNEIRQQQIVNLKRQNKTILTQKTGETTRLQNIVFDLILVLGFGAVSAILFWLYTYKQREIIHQQELSRISMLRLQNIRNRISPHFMFNFLNHEISTDENNAKKQTMIGMVTFLRRSLEIAEQISVTLDEEMDFVKNYLQLEQNTLDDDFCVLWDVDARVDSRLFRIPAMVIQIPVENALKHALRPKKGEKRLHISIVLLEKALLISIQDNGDGYHPERLLNTKGTGTGLKVLYQTIEVLNVRNSDQILFTIQDVNEDKLSGTKVEVIVPQKYNFEL